MGSQRGSASVTTSQKARAVRGFIGGGREKKINLSKLAPRSSSNKKKKSEKSKPKK